MNHPDFMETVQTALLDFGIQPGDKLLAAVSGGADSTALLFALCALREQYHFDLTAAHLNHLLRGEESMRDEAFVADMCRRWAVPLVIERRDIAALARQAGRGIEETARAERYAFLYEAVGDGFILTAHTKTDHLETVLFNLTRGSGSKGLCGIPARRGNILRPLLPLSRSDVEAFCAAGELPYITDSSNGDETYTRNFLRNRVIPDLKEINPKLEDAVFRLSQALRMDEDFFAAQVKAVLAESALADGGYDLNPLRALHPAILNRVCMALVKCHCGKTSDFKQTEALADLIKTGGRMDFYGTHRAYTHQNRLEIEPVTAIKPWKCEIFVGQRIVLRGFEVTANLIPIKNFLKSEKIYKKALNICLDYDRIIRAPFLRGRLPGDRFHPAGRGTGKSLKKLFNEVGVPHGRRELLPVLCDGAGILGVCGFGVDARAQLTESTTQVLVIEINKLE